MILAFYHSSILSFHHSSIQATPPYFYRFYKNLFKNPLLFIIPPFISLLFLFYFSFISLLFLFYFSFISLLFLFYFSFISLLFLFYFSFINPHRIFKPFDSISPIFKSVGLTELNSIQGEDDGSVRRFKSA
ncbi:hypothetical protein [Helicobacter pylori]|uniref:hypothetical protein n=1 Tax=Helicobacter pylori TaxID=210 RepID=UPI001F092850|nr:hypothetical protein [Helicobacter pylori]